MKSVIDLTIKEFIERHKSELSGRLKNLPDVIESINKNLYINEKPIITIGDLLETMISGLDPKKRWRNYGHKTEAQLRWLIQEHYPDIYKKYFTEFYPIEEISEDEFKKMTMRQLTHLLWWKGRIKVKGLASPWEMSFSNVSELLKAIENGTIYNLMDIGPMTVARVITFAKKYWPKMVLPTPPSISRCPNCQRLTLIKNNFCPFCGQKLK